ncbi:hypothetical protein EIMP300_03510 [Escherichia coli]|uniref:Homoserine O-succinyltransferase n=1 Tax=Escherichia coli TaxID=562 RepID=A0A8S0FEY6_ECOLX|nr:hypothetical protein EIMP300_03510 [Escherichia coli]
MPIRVPDELPAVNFLREENVFVMTTSRASGQEIRPLKVLILNLMPKKIETENQFLRLLSNSPLQVSPLIFSCCASIPVNRATRPQSI